jgi:hypothetical protein
MARMDSPLPVKLYRWWMVVWAGHALAALGWWWLKPPGYPASHPHFWCDRVAPPLIFGLSMLGLWALRTSRPGLLATLAVFPPAAWILATTIALLLFPISWFRLSLALIPPTLVLIVLTMWLWRWRPAPILPALGMLVPALLASSLMVWPQRSLEPDTRPLDEPLAEVAGTSDAKPEVVSLGEAVSVLTERERVDVLCGGLHLKVQPLLTFHRRSPDRCWSIFARPNQQLGPPRTLTSWRTGGRNEIQLQYHDDDVSTLKVHAEPGEAVGIEAHSRLRQPVYSHLNSWCEFRALGEQPISLAFSPCPQKRISVEAWGDFIGGRLRLAYRDGQDGFHVVEAYSNDKGPFRELAAGKLGRHDPLSITLYEGERAACTLVFEDWASQVGEAISPCAGYGLPANAIEFSRYRADPAGACNVNLSLAATSVGRGRDTVGHTPGVYRNRMRIQPCTEEKRLSER